jgi:ribosomal 30S subunit maturation factor RimM
VFADIDTKARAAGLVGLEFSIHRGRRSGGCDGGRALGDGSGCSDFEGSERDEGDEAGGELWLEDFVGWDAEFDTGQSGRVTGYIDSEYNPLFEVELSPGTSGRGGSENGGASGGVGGGTELIPACDDFIVEVDEHRRKVVFSLPEGLIGLNK